MKRTLLFYLSLFGAFALCLFFLLRERKEPFRPEAPRLVCLMPPEKEYYWGKVREGIAAADEDLGCYTRIASYERYDVSSHVDLVEECRYCRVDGIITIGEPASPALNAAIASFVQEGIPVALMDTDAPESGRSFYIGTDNQKAGREAALRLLSACPKPVMAGIIITGIDDANQRERLQGFQEALEKGGGELLFVYENQSDKTALGTFLEEELAKKEGLNALFDAEASTTSFLSLFLEEHPGHGLYTIGFDEVAPTAQKVAEGVLAATFIQQGHEMGYEAVRTLLEYIQDPAKQPAEIYTQAVLAGPDTIREYIDP